MPSMFKAMGGSMVGADMDFSASMSAGMINANIMADQVRMGTFHGGGLSSSVLGPTQADNIGNWGIFNISLGQSVPWFVPRVIKVSGLPEIRKPAPEQIAVPAQVIRKAPPQIQVNIPPKIGREPVPVSVKAIPIPQVSSSPLPTIGGGLKQTQVTFGDTKMALDLGALLGTAITAYGGVQEARYAQPVFNPQAFNPFSDVPLTNAFETGGSPTVVAPGVIPKGYKINCDGKLVKCRRRRRRRLATASDIKDLASLSSVTTGKQKETWIATHPS